MNEYYIRLVGSVSLYFVMDDEEMLKQSTLYLTPSPRPNLWNIEDIDDHANPDITQINTVVPFLLCLIVILIPMLFNELWIKNVIIKLFNTFSNFPTLPGVRSITSDSCEINCNIKFIYSSIIHVRMMFLIVVSIKFIIQFMRHWLSKFSKLNVY